MARLKTPPLPDGDLPPELNNSAAPCWQSDAATTDWYRRHQLGRPETINGTIWDRSGRGPRRRQQHALTCWALTHGYTTQYGTPDWHRLRTAGYGKP